METVNAVQWLSVFSDTICGSPSRSATAALIGVQISPFAWLAIEIDICLCRELCRADHISLILPVRVICHENDLPARRSSIASSIVLYCSFIFSCLSRAFLIKNFLQQDSY